MPEPTIPELLADLKEKLAKATPLPWGLVLANTRTVDYANAAANAAPRLADEVERLERQVTEQSALITSQGIRLMQADDDTAELERLRKAHADLVFNVLARERHSNDTEQSILAEAARLHGEREVAIETTESLQKAIEAAPHGVACEMFGDNLPPHAGVWMWHSQPIPERCNCWKAALAAKMQEVADTGRELEARR